MCVCTEESMFYARKKVSVIVTVRKQKNEKQARRRAVSLLVRIFQASTRADAGFCGEEFHGRDGELAGQVVRVRRP